MRDASDQPFTVFLADLNGQLAGLSERQQAEIERELLAHLEDAAADEQAACDDPVFQRHVIARLGRSTEMAQAFQDVYSGGWGRLRYLGFLVLLLAAVAQITISLTYLFLSYPIYRLHALSTEHWSGRWDAAQQAMVWQLEVGPSHLPAPWLNLLSVGGMTVLGLALLTALLLYRRGVQRAQRVILAAVPLSLLGLVLFQGFEGTRFTYLLFAALPGLLGLLILLAATRRQAQLQP